MDYVLAVLVGMISLLIASVTWALCHQRRNPISGCGRIANVCEYIGIYVDDLAIVAKDPREIVDVLERKYKLKLKGTGPISFHLCMGFFCDEDGVLCLSPKRYIERMISTYVTLFGTKPSMKYSSPLKKGDHPETDDSEFLDATSTQQYQSLIGALQWSVSIGHFNITTAVMTMSSFCAMP